MKIAGLILAAGASTRMGSPKALLKFRGETFLDRLIGILASHCAPVIVVLGHQAEAIEAGLRRAGQARLVLNPDHRKGQLSSLQCGLRAVPSESRGVLFTPVDHPAVEPATVQRLVEQAGRVPPPLLVIPRYEGRGGHPVCCARDLIPEFLALPAVAQAREVIRRHLEHTCYVEVEDPGILKDVDDPEAYRRLIQA
jgi:CTP:molybdopterin cytidylyltransferase MocA